MLTATGDAGTYAGQQTSPGSGGIELQLPALDESNDVVVDLATIVWLDQPDDVNDGYRHYVFDAASIDFSIPGGLSVAGSEPAVLALSFADMSDFLIDADPATPVDWQQGGWAGYEDEDGVAADRGGIDCQIKPFVAMETAATAPAADVNCRSAVTPPPPPPPPPVQPSSGGGGHALWLCLLLLPAFGRFQRRRTSAT